MWQLSCDAAGCRLVQDVLHHASRKVAVELVSEIHGHCQEAIQSPHANFVVQKIIEVMPAGAASFIVSEIRDIGAIAVAQDCFGCRVVCRLLEHSPTDERTAALVDEIVAEAPSLCQHQFGHHIAECVLEHGLAEQRHRICDELRSDAPSYAKTRCGSFVIEKALTYASLEDQRALTSALCSSLGDVTDASVAAWAETVFGCCVLRAVLRQPPTAMDVQQISSYLQSVAPQLRKTKHGGALLADVGLA